MSEPFVNPSAHPHAAANEERVRDVAFVALSALLVRAICSLLIPPLTGDAGSFFELARGVLHGHGFTGRDRCAVAAQLRAPAALSAVHRRRLARRRRASRRSSPRRSSSTSPPPSSCISSRAHGSAEGAARSGGAGLRAVALRCRHERPRLLRVACRLLHDARGVGGRAGQLDNRAACSPSRRSPASAGARPPSIGPTCRP